MVLKNTPFPTRPAGRHREGGTSPVFRKESTRGQERVPYKFQHPREQRGGRWGWGAPGARMRGGKTPRLGVQQPAPPGRGQRFPRHPASHRIPTKGPAQGRSMKKRDLVSRANREANCDSSLKNWQGQEPAPLRARPAAGRPGPGAKGRPTRTLAGTLGRASGAKEGSGALFVPRLATPARAAHAQ